MENLSLQIKCSFSKINSTLFCPTFVYSTFTKLSSHQWDQVLRIEMGKLFSENNFFENACSITFHIDISEINNSAA